MAGYFLCERVDTDPSHTYNVCMERETMNTPDTFSKSIFRMVLGYSRLSLMSVKDVAGVEPTEPRAILASLIGAQESLHIDWSSPNPEDPDPITADHMALVKGMIDKMKADADDGSALDAAAWVILDEVKREDRRIEAEDAAYAA